MKLLGRARRALSVRALFGSIGSVGLLVVLGTTAAWGQPPELVTDRPDQTESTEVVAPGAVQIEVGVGRTEEDEDGVESETTELGSTLVRIGLADRLELRVGWGGLIDEEVTLAGGRRLEASGAADMDLGLKLRLADGGGSRPSLALIAASSLPAGDDEVGSDRADPGFLLAAAHELGEVDLGYNAGMAWESVADAGGDLDTVYSWVYSVAAGVGLGGKLGAYGEVFGRIPGNADGGSESSLDGGLTYLYRPNLQFDVSVGLGLSEAAPDWFVSAGFSIRLPE